MNNVKHVYILKEIVVGHPAMEINTDLFSFSEVWVDLVTKESWPKPHLADFLAVEVCLSFLFACMS